MLEEWLGWIMPVRNSTMKKGDLYKKSLIIVLIIACLPAALIGGSFYVIGTHQIEQEVIQTHRSQLEKARKRIDDQLTHIELTASQWALNPLFDDKLKDMDLYKQFMNTQDLYTFLSIIKNSSTLIDQVYLYLDGKHLFISEEGGIRQLAEERNAIYHQLLTERTRAIFWARTPQGPGRSNSAISLMHVLPGSGAQKYGALVITLNETKVNDMVHELTVEKGGSSFLVQGTGLWVTTGIDGMENPGKQEQFFHDEVVNRTSSADSFIVKWNKEDYSVSYGTMSRLSTNWLYVTVSPVNQLIAPVTGMSRMILIISGIGITTAIFLSWFGSAKLYKPIHHLISIVRGSNASKPYDTQDSQDELSFLESQWKHMMQESHNLQFRLEQQLPTLRDGFLLQLVQGHLYQFNEKELHDRMKRFGWNVEERRFSIMVVQLIGFFNSPRKFLEKDRQLITFAAANIVEELTGKRMDTYSVINFQDLTIGLLFMFPADKDWRQFKSELFKLADEITCTLNGLLKLQVIISIGKSADFMTEIPNVLQEVRQTLPYRVLEENNQILDMDEIVPLGTDASSYYPIQIEKELLQAIRRGDAAEMNRQLEHFFAALSSYCLTEYAFLQSALYVLANILQTTTQIGFNPHHLYKGDNLFEQLVRKREQDEIKRWFQHKVFEPFVKEYSDTQNLQVKSIVKSAIDIIETRYTNNISLEACADELGVHPIRLSKSFKQITGITFIDYLTKVRIDKSKELLCRTDQRIHDIAMQVGYQPTYFNKIFRKQEGITASEYRRSLFRG
jgi:AraC-like DNA-binding protein